MQAIEKFKCFLPNETSVIIQEMKTIIKTETPDLKRIVVKIGYNLKIVLVEEIQCFFSENKIVYLQTKERKFPTDFSLEELESLLNKNNFFRVNRQFIVNCNYIKNIHTSPYHKIDLEFESNMEIAVSRNRLKDFKYWLYFKS